MEIKIPLFAFLICSEGYDGFPKHLDLALAHNKTKKGLRSNESFGNMINCGALSLISSIQKMHMFIGTLAARDRNRVDVKVWTAA